MKTRLNDQRRSGITSDKRSNLTNGGLCDFCKLTMFNTNKIYGCIVNASCATNSTKENITFCLELSLGALNNAMLVCD